MRDTEDRLIFLLRVIFLADTCGFAIICNQYVNRYVFICNNVFLLLFLSLNLFLVCTQFAKQCIQHAKHSTPQLRLNGIVSNIPEFSEAFH
ncbi:hypothetical protein ALC53_03960 [Atta colombica]|uniref:Uncharacterized protein n=1 Tax=Atta colombica TaxID=520822 RepID=A0A195BLD6_9HYME|nr:hypothetical protein ALC53_03960 [Atta colombica]